MRRETLAAWEHYYICVQTQAKLSCDERREYTQNTHRVQSCVSLSGFLFPWHFLQRLKGFFDVRFASLRIFFNRQTYKHDKYLIQEPLCFKAQNIQRAPCLALKQLLRSWNKKGLPKSLQISCHQFNFSDDTMNDITNKNIIRALIYKMNVLSVLEETF